MRSERPVAIVGGGFSGTMVAAQLARRDIACVLIESTDRLGLGTAFSTREPAHVLNVRAEAMSAFPDDADHFVRFAQSEGVTGADFAERRLFGRYMRQLFDDAIASGLVGPVRDRAIAARPGEGCWTIALESGGELEASALVLAIGNQPPQPLSVEGPDTHRFIANPWGDESRAAVEAAARDSSDVVLIGSSLTMIDLVLSLDSAGHRGRITAVSRRGLVPRSHSDVAATAVEAEDVPLGSVRALWRWIRRRSVGGDWRAVVDSLRPQSHRIWESLPLAERKRFSRHARPWWDVHRHRIAPSVAQRIADLMAAGRLQIIAGRLGRIAADRDGVAVTVVPRGGGHEETLPAAFVFNCTGPLGSISRTRDPLLKQMLSDGLVRPDALGIGLDGDDHSRLAGSRRSWALGPLTKGRFWEIIAVPDIRGQAAQVAEDIAMELGR